MAPVQQWISYSGQATDEWSGGIASFSNGDIATAFSVSNPNGSSSVIVQRLNGSGTVLWSLDIGADYAPGAGSILVGTDDKIYVTGGTKTGSTGESGKNDSDVFAAAITSSGQRLWYKNYRYGIHEIGASAVLDGNGNILLEGRVSEVNDSYSFIRDVSNFYGAEYSSGWRGFQLRVNPSDGTITKAYTTGSGNSGGGPIAIDRTRNICFVSGYTFGAVNGVNTVGNGDPNGANTYLIARNESTSSVLWTRMLNWMRSNIATKEAEDSVYFVDKGLLTKIRGTTGQTIWTRSIGNTHYVLSPIASGGILLSESSSSGTLVVRRFDSSGIETASQTINHTGNFYPRSFIEKGDGTLLVSGSTTGSITSAGITTTNSKQGGSDALVLSIKSAFSGVQIYNDGQASFRIDGSATPGQTLTINRSSDDPDGNGSLTYTWQSSINGSSWSTIGSGQSYQITRNEQGRDIRALVAYTDGEGFLESVTIASLKVPFTNDGQASFRIEGSANSGQTLTINRSSDDPDGNGSPNYTWQSSTNGSWNTIGSGQSYQITKNEQGKEIRALVSYTDGEGFQESITTASLKIPFTNDGQATFRIDGSASHGQSLTINRSSDDPDGNGAPSYTWQSFSKGSWSTIGSGQSYQITRNEQGKDIRALIAYTDGEGFQESVTTSSIKVPFTNDGQASFRIDGSAIPGQSLTIHRSSDDPDENGTPTYTWQSSSNGSWSTIGSGQSYQITRNEQGKDIRALITYTDGEGFQESITTASLKVPFTNDGQASFRVDGSAIPGQSLTVNRSSDDPDGNGTLNNYTWQSSTNGTWSTIGTGQSYQFNKNDQGKDIRALINYTDGEGFQESITTSIIKVPFTNDGKASFRIDGTATPGQSLSVIRSIDDPDGNGSPSYSWQSSSNGSEWSLLGTGQSYQVNNADQGKQIRVIVNYEDAEGFKESAETLPIKVPFTNDGSASFKINAEGDQLTIIRASDDPDGNGTPTYTWRSQEYWGAPWILVGNGSTYTVTKADQGKLLRVEISYKDGEGFDENPAPLMVPILKPKDPVYKITPSKTFINEGETLSTTITSENATPGTNLYWSLTGDGIDKNDFSKGALTGKGVLDGNGSLTISHSIKEDLSINEEDETINIAIFSDPTRTKLLTAPVAVVINDSSAEDPKERSRRTFDGEVQDYKVDTNAKNFLSLTEAEKFKSWALWGEGCSDKLIGGAKDDYLIGGDGIDDLTGGKGSDTFVMSDFVEKNYDIIKDFVAKDDVIGISTNLIDASEDDTVAVVKYQDIKTKASAEKFFKTKGVDQYILVDTAENINKVNSKGYSEKILLAVDLTAKSIRYDADGVWNKGSDVLCKFTGKMSFNSWSGDNFAFGIDLV